jgi:hypothetical protein
MIEGWGGESGERLNNLVSRISQAFLLNHARIARTEFQQTLKKVCLNFRSGLSSGVPRYSSSRFRAGH